MFRLARLVAGAVTAHGSHHAARCLARKAPMARVPAATQYVPRAQTSTPMHTGPDPEHSAQNNDNDNGGIELRSVRAECV